jgi:cell wall-associated NlpC family hydrolase
MQACSDLDAQLRDYVGIPFVNHGRSTEQHGGLDCWGLVLAAARQVFGREFPDYCDYKEAEKICDVSPLFEGRRDWRQVEAGRERAGDVVVLRIAGHATHAGLVVRPGLMLHTMTFCHSCIESYRGAKWRCRVEGFYAWFPR